MADIDAWADSVALELWEPTGPWYLPVWSLWPGLKERCLAALQEHDAARLRAQRRQHEGRAARDQRWWRCRHLLQRFVRENHRLPSRGESAGGEQLGQWVRAQRDRSRRGGLTAVQEHALSTIPGWAPRSIHDAWAVAFDALREFEHEHGRLPTRAEAAGISTWAARQRQAYANGALSAEHAELLESIPGWSWGAAAWTANCAALRAFVAERRRLPDPSSEDADEKAIGSWARHQCQLFAGGGLSPDQMGALAAVPGWPRA